MSVLTLRQPQQEDVATILRHKFQVIVANGQGTGKTPTSVVALTLSHETKCPAVIVCPASVVLNWKKELRRWGKGLKIQIVHGSKERPKPLPHPAVYVVSWASLPLHVEAFKTLNIRAVIADEAHFAKNPDALRTQALRELVTTKSCSGLLLLTGTPVINATDEFDVLKSLFPSKNPKVIRRVLEDVAPDVPNKKRSYVGVKLIKADHHEYQRAVADFEDWLTKEKESLMGEGKAYAAVERILSAEALIKVGYLRRIAGRGKAYAAAEWASTLVRLGEQVVLFAEHKSVVRRMVQFLRHARVPHRIIDGGTTNKKRQKYIEDFQNHKYPVIICTKAGQTGITLTAARHLIFAERFWTSAEEEQAEDRIRRIGQTSETTMWFIHASGTIDDSLDAIVKRKRSIVKNAIGLPDVVESKESAILEIVQRWGSYAKIDLPVTNLGQSSRKTIRLPAQEDTLCIVFGKSRWTPEAALMWAKMVGYTTQEVTETVNGYQLRLNSLVKFDRNSLKSYPLSKDITAIVCTE